MLPQALSSNHCLSSGLSTIDPTLQHPGQYNWTFPVDGNQHQRSIPGSTGSNTISPHVSVPHRAVETLTRAYICQDPSSKHLNREDFLNIIHQANEHDLTTSGNGAYMRLELSLSRVTNEKTQLESLKRSLEDEVIRLQTRLQTIECVLV